MHMVQHTVGHTLQTCYCTVNGEGQCILRVEVSSFINTHTEHLQDLKTRLKEEEAASHEYALAKNSRSGRRPPVES